MPSASHPVVGVGRQRGFRGETFSLCLGSARLASFELWPQREHGGDYSTGSGRVPIKDFGFSDKLSGGLRMEESSLVGKFVCSVVGDSAADDFLVSLCAQGG